LQVKQIGCMATRIVITGAPGSGKTDFLNRLAQSPEFDSFVFFDELARKLLEENPDLRHDKREFHHQIYHRQIEREDSLNGRSFITDRGTVDAFAFHPETALYVGTTITREYERYDMVVHLGSSASLGEPYYACDDVRNESVAEALAIEAALRKVWIGHPNYRFVAAHVDYEMKFQRFYSLVKSFEHAANRVIE
jgi:predicted ATPase